MMSETYYASFAPVKLSRHEVLDRIIDPLHQHGVAIDVDLYELRLTSESFEYTFNEIECKSVWEGVKRTESWDGVEFHFTLFERGCSYMLLSEAAGQTTVVFTEPKRLFEEQLDSVAKASELLKFLTETIEIIGAEFCILEPGWIGRSRTAVDVELWASEIEAGHDRDWEFIILAQATWPYEALMKRISTKYRGIVVSPLVWIAIKNARLPI